MEKIIKKFVISFILIALIPCLSLILFQKYQTERQPQMPHMMMGGFHSEFGPGVPMNAPKPPIAIPIIILALSCVGLCLIWTKYLKKTFILPLKDIIQGLEEFKKGNLDIKFETNSENDFIINAFKTLNLMVENTKEKEKLKSNHIQNLVHDLRAPILAQDRALKILKEEFEEHELVEGLEKNTKKYINLINLILESYQYHSSEMKIKKCEVNFDYLIKDIIRELQPLAKEKNISISYCKQNDNPVIYADYFSLTRIMTNLIANSIENIENDKTITIKFENDKQICIIVEDNGCGIEEEKLKTIFDRYASDSKTKVVSGLGLNIVKELVEKNDGKIIAQSVLNKYTRFKIVFNKEEK